MKAQRQSKIIELIDEFEVETQEELAKYLKNCGFNVTQATISRDIRELMIGKVLTDEKKFKYAVNLPAKNHLNDRYVRVFRDSVVSVDYAGNMLILKTLQGTAQGVAAALDSMNYPESIGSLAGNDIIFCATKSEEKAILLMNKLKVFAHGR